MRENFWFADQTTAEADEDDHVPGYPWQPFLQQEGCVSRIDIRFATEAACVQFIQTEVLGAGFKP